MLGFLEEYDDVLAHMHTADVFASPSTREGFGITFAEAMAADCTVIAAEYPKSAASEVIDEAFLATPTVDDLAAVLERALHGDRPATDSGSSSPALRLGCYCPGSRAALPVCYQR